MSARTRIFVSALAFTMVGVAAALCLGLPVGEATAQVRPRPGDKTGQIVVAYKSGAAGAVRRVVTERGGRVERGYSKPGILVVEAHEADSDELMRTLSLRRDVRYAEESRVVGASWSPNDPDYYQQWNLRRVGSEEAWGVERGTPSVTVAVIDSGVDLEHPDFIGRLDTIHDRDFVTTDSARFGIADDQFGHGTHVAGIIGAATDNGRYVAGLAHGCTILPVRVLDEAGFGDTTGLALGILHAADNSATVINISAGSPVGTRTMEDAVAYATARGCIIVAAAGNRASSRLDYPAAYPEVIAVGAVGNDDQRWPYSSYSNSLDLVAPGITIWNTSRPQDSIGILSLMSGNGTYGNGATGTLYGTSMAAPHVAGAAALLRSAHTTWTASEVVHRLLVTAEDVGAIGRDAYTGYGLLRSDLALGAGAPPTSTVLDDSLPGRPLTDASVRGLISASDDVVDTYAISLYEGQHFSATLNCESGAQRLEVFEPQSNGESPILASPAATSGTGTSISFEVTRTGTHSLRVRAQQGAGEYRLSWERGYFTRTLVGASPTCAWGGVSPVSGIVNSYLDEPVGLVPVVLDAWPAGAQRWSLGVASTRADVSGKYVFRPRPTRRTRYRVRFLGDPGEYASVSSTITVTPRAALGAPTPGSAITRNREFRLTGVLRPEHRTGAKTVLIRAWRRESGVWVLRHSVYATNLDRDGYTRYLGRMRITRRGSWRFVAYVPGDSIHAPTRSAAKYAYVR